MNKAQDERFMTFFSFRNELSENVSLRGKMGEN